ncbi:DUF6286 domain-containing Asp23/Gls24 family envelope stress response protein [Streptomyces zaomyceticus]|uniref:DUF6286 domain-containing Asp23/Gls24 family envelope stress response protein n=1 Tax=Streptomyces zaomyceticus TaxID=68286 RepID=UPI003724A40C
MNAAERGVTTVADRVSAKIARQAAAEATGLAGGRVLRSTAGTRGRCVEVTVEVDLPLPAASDTDQMIRLRDHLTRRTRSLTGLSIAPAHLRIRRLTAPTPSPTSSPTPCPRPAAQQPLPLRVSRPWSPRRAATVGLAVAVALLSALMLWTVLQQHLPGTAAPPWRQVRQWTTVSGGRPYVRLAAAVATAAGAWLILLALSPGHRRLLPLRCHAPARAVISRTHAARLIRAAVTEVPGLRVHAVRFTPRKVTVRAEAAYGTPRDIRDHTLETIERTLRTIPLRHTPEPRLVLRDAHDPHTASTRSPAREDEDV